VLLCLMCLLWLKKECGQDHHGARILVPTTLEHREVSPRFIINPVCMKKVSSYNVCAY
jgi:hypothetical protein